MSRFPNRVARVAGVMALWMAAGVSPALAQRGAPPPPALPELPSQASAQADAVLEGEVEVLFEDSAAGGRLIHALLVSGQRIPMQFASEPPAALTTGTRVRARGRLENGTLMLQGGGDVQTLAAIAPNTFGEQKTIVILVNFQDNASQPYDWAHVQRVTFDQASAYYFESSYQQTWLTGDVTGWYTLPMSAGTCDPYTLSSLADQAATSHGVNLSAYRRKIYAFPNMACSWWGLGSIGGSPSRAWVNGSYALKVVAHELGHNFGAYHAKSQPCDAGGCSTIEYGDDRDIMGLSATGHFTSFFKEQFGWLNYGSSPSLLTVNQPNAYWIDAYAPATGTGAPRGLKILQSVDSSGRRTFYYVEARTSYGYDATIPAGVLVHTGSEATANSSVEVDLSPMTSAFDSTLDAGQMFEDASIGLRITTLWADATGAMVDVSFGSTPCTARAPQVTLSPGGTVLAMAGSSAAYTLTVRDMDDAGCGDGTFSTAAAVPGGWSASLPASLTVAPGATVSVPVSIGVPSGAAGMNAFNVNLTRSEAGASVTGQISVVSSLDVSLSITTGRGGYVISVSASAGGAPVSGAAVSIALTDPRGGTKTWSTSTDGRGNASVSFKPKRNDPGGTYLVGVVVNASGLIGGASGSFEVR